MSRNVKFYLVVLLLACAEPCATSAAEPSTDTAKAIEEFNKDATAIRKRADEEILTRRAKLIDKLQSLQNSYTKEAKLDEAVAIRDLIRQLKTVSAVSKQVEVLSGGTWWPAVIRQEKDGKYFVHYTGWADSWDEWVTPERIRSKAGAEASLDILTVPAKKAEVLSGSTWWAAEVLQEKDGKYFIHYTGWADSWNEWVDKDHIRFAQSSEGAPDDKAAAPAK